jgi:hypothetical protein
MEGQGTLLVDCGRAAERLSRELGAAGLRVTRSFDLQSARHALRDPESCPCPHHGTADCTCQYVVLLVDAGGGSPLTLVAHGHDGETHLSIDGLGSVSARVAGIVRSAVAGLAALAPLEV